MEKNLRHVVAYYCTIQSHQVSHLNESIVARPIKFQELSKRIAEENVSTEERSQKVNEDSRQSDSGWKIRPVKVRNHNSEKDYCLTLVGELRGGANRTQEVRGAVLKSAQWLRETLWAF